MSFWDWSFLGNTLRIWLVALLITLPLLLGARVLQKILARRFSEPAAPARQASELVARLTGSTRFSLLATLALYVGSQVLVLPAQTDNWLGTAAWIALLLQAAIWGNEFISFWLTCYQKQHLETDASRVTTIRALGFVARLTLISIVALLVLDNIPGIQVTTLIASLGVGGIAVALAVQNMLADLFASLSIAFDKPFVIGDFIVVGEFMGTVEHIGLKTTRLRSLSGEQLIISNNDLLGSRIRNYKRMSERRVSFSINVTYQTPYEKLEKIPTLLREIIQAQPKTRLDRAHFKAYGDYALTFEVVYFMLDADYSIYMDTQQAINLAIYRRFAQEGIEFAYPTRTLFVHGGATPQARLHSASNNAG